MTHEEAIETCLAMAEVQDGYAKRATNPGLRLIHKANAKAQREVADVLAASEAREAKLREGLEDIADPKRLQSHGDPVVLRDRARAALQDTAPATGEQP